MQSVLQGLYSIEYSPKMLTVGEMVVIKVHMVMINFTEMMYVAKNGLILYCSTNHTQVKWSTHVTHVANMQTEFANPREYFAHACVYTCMEIIACVRDNTFVTLCRNSALLQVVL